MIALNRPGVVVLYSRGVGRHVAVLVVGGRVDERRTTSAVVAASPDGRTVQTYSGSTYTITGEVLLQRSPGAYPEMLAADGTAIDWSTVADGIEVLT